MNIEVAVDGLGRIGRAILKLVIDGDSVKVLSWPDKQPGNAHQMLRAAVSISGSKASVQAIGNPA